MAFLNIQDAIGFNSIRELMLVNLDEHSPPHGLARLHAVGLCTLQNDVAYTSRIAGQYAYMRNAGLHAKRKTAEGPSTALEV